MRKFRGKHESRGRPNARLGRRRTGWVLTGGLLAGGLVVGAVGLTGIAPMTGGTDFAGFDMSRLTSIVSSPDASDGKDPKNPGEPRGSKEGKDPKDPEGKRDSREGKGRDDRDRDDRGRAYGSDGCERSDHRDGGWSDGRGEERDGRCESEWDGEHRKVLSVPCDSDELIAALVHANAVGGATLKLARKCTYTLTAYDEHKIWYEGQAGRNDENDEAVDSGSPERSDDDPDIDYDATEKTGLPLVYQPIRIKGEGATITRPAQAEGFRFFTVRDGGELELDDVTLENGQAAEGGAVKVDFGGTAILEHTTITKSVAHSSKGGGGAVFNDGHTTISESTFTENSAVGEEGCGGGVLNGGVLTVEKSEFVGNSANGYGGGLANFRGAADIGKSTFTHNSAAEGGGFASVSARTKVWDSKVTRNTAKTGGGILNEDATLTLRHLTVSDNVGLRDGGGISTAKGLLVVDDSEIKANTTFGNGGGVAARESNVIIRKTKITDNDASGSGSVGGGIFAEKGKLVLFRTRVTENDATDEPGGVFAKQVKVEVDEETVIIRNRPTNCEGSPEEIPNCFG